MSKITQIVIIRPVVRSFAPSLGLKMKSESTEVTGHGESITKPNLSQTKNSSYFNQQIQTQALKKNHKL
jgi:hypothetical protein